VELTEHLDPAAIALIENANTFFIASSYLYPADEGRAGPDISHRGGPPGFVKVQDGRTLTWPDFKGNFFFNTLGNIIKDPRCGLLFINFDSGDTLQLSGIATVIWNVPADRAVDHMAQRLVQFVTTKAVLTRAAIPFRWMFEGMAPQFAGTARELRTEKD
jgi:uncharacterized protein